MNKYPQQYTDLRSGMTDVYTRGPHSFCPALFFLFVAWFGLCACFGQEQARKTAWQQDTAQEFLQPPLFPYPIRQTAFHCAGLSESGKKSSLIQALNFKIWRFHWIGWMNIKHFG